MDNFNKLTKDKNLKFNLKPLTMRQLMDQINQMKSTPSTGVDNLSLKIIKQVIPVIKNQFIHLVNASISSGIYPQNLECAKLITVAQS